MEIEWFSFKEANGRIDPWNESSTLLFFELLFSKSDCTSRRTSGRTPFHPRPFFYFLSRASFVDPSTCRRLLFTDHDNGRYARQQFPWLLRWPDCILSRLLLFELRPTIANLLEDDPHQRSNRVFHSLRSWVCHHTGDPTVLSRMSCQPFFFPSECWPFSPALPVTLTYPLLPRLTTDSWTGIVEDCRRRITIRPFTLADGSNLPPLRLTGGFCHAD